MYMACFQLPTETQYAYKSQSAHQFAAKTYPELSVFRNKVARLAFLHQ